MNFFKALSVIFLKIIKNIIVRDEDVYENEVSNVENEEKQTHTTNETPPIDEQSLPIGNRIDLVGASKGSEKPEEPEIKKDLITKDQFKELFPRGKVSLVSSLNKLLEKNEINTLNRVSSFLAQCGHESANFRIFIENLNYSKTALLNVFGKYFDKETAVEYARKPEKIANRVYGNRMENGPESSGDGWRFRGRGLIQLTGRRNYRLFAKYKSMTIEEVVDYCETNDGIVESAIWFWNTNNLNKFADNDDLRGQTRVINGGFNGIDHRMELYEKGKQILKID